MHARLLVSTSATVLFMSVGATLAQDEMTSDSPVRVSVAGTMVEVPVSLAAQACGLDEATIMANAFTQEMDAEEGGEEVTVAPDPTETQEDMLSSDGAAAADTSAATGTETQPEGSSADEVAAADVADEATTAAAGETASEMPDTASTADNSADSATADEAAETVDGVEAVASEGAAGAAVCEIDQATAEQFGFPAGG